MIKGLNHVGLSVSNLDRSVEFYRKAFGMKVVAEWKFYPGLQEGRYEEILGLEGAAGRGASVQVGTLKLEMFEFAQPVPKRSDPHRPVCDHGITHFCVEVENIEAEYQRLKALGATFHCPPLSFSGSKAKATYVRDPDGNVFELIELGLNT